MRRNCNLELRLVPPSAAGFLSPEEYNTPVLDLLNRNFNEEQEQQQQLTIFYGGKVAACDVTELQARAIIRLASGEREREREREEKSESPASRSSSEPSSPLLQSQMCSPTAALSMKRSLQRFLHKRKNRVQAAFPYHR